MTTPTIVAHRGIHSEHPENSLKALLAAWDAGIDWCECDVRGSLEHEPFLLHDGTLERTTDGSGTIEQTPSSVLHRLNLRKHDGTVAATCVPRLKTVLEAMPSHGKLLIEIKPKVTDEVVGQTLELCDETSCVVQSFDRDILHLAAKVRPEIRRVLLVDDAALPSTMQPGPWEGVNARHDTLMPEHVEQLREMGKKVGVWTPNEQADIRRAIGLGVDTLITDQPLRAVGLLRALARLR